VSRNYVWTCGCVSVCRRACGVCINTKHKKHMLSTFHARNRPCRYCIEEYRYVHMYSTSVHMLLRCLHDVPLAATCPYCCRANQSVNWRPHETHSSVPAVRARSCLRSPSLPAPFSASHVLTSLCQTFNFPAVYLAVQESIAEPTKYGTACLSFLLLSLFHL
jgi:hypothetical protein